VYVAQEVRHINAVQLKKVLMSDAVKGAKVSEVKDFFCEACQFEKAHRLTFDKQSRSGSDDRYYKPGELIHTDVCGPFSEKSIGGAKFYLLFIDEATDYRVVYFIKHKSDVSEKVKEFNQLVHNRYGHSIKILRADRASIDNDREYINREIGGYMIKREIKLETTAPYTPQQNGKAQRENCTIVKSARTMLQARNLPIKLWTEAVNTAVYILNRTAIKKDKSVTPFEVWNKKKPELSHSRIFGTEAYAHIDKMFRKM